MKALSRWATRSYPRAWRDRYGCEFDQLLEDIEPTGRDLWNIVFGALATQSKAMMEDGAALWAQAIPPGQLLYVRGLTLLAVTAQLAVLGWVLLVSRAPIVRVDAIGPLSPPPPPGPAPLTEMTDPRVYHDSPFVYSSLPMWSSGRGDALSVNVTGGVGIHFPPLADIGTADRRPNPMRVVWPGRALESSIVRRVIPRFPSEGRGRAAVRVFLEYLIGTDGSVKVLRASGPADFAEAAKTAVKKWRYRPVWIENHVVQVLSRVELKFDGALSDSAH